MVTLCIKLFASRRHRSSLLMLTPPVDRSTAQIASQRCLPSTSKSPRSAGANKVCHVLLDTDPTVHRKKLSSRTTSKQGYLLYV